MLSNKVQYIVSCLPIDLHKKYCKKLLATNKPVLIEKPLHDNFLELKKIMSRVNNTINNKIIGYNRRHYKTVDILRRRIKKGGLKNVEITISENYQNLVKKYKKCITCWIIKPYNRFSNIFIWTIRSI